MSGKLCLPDFTYNVYDKTNSNKVLINEFLFYLSKPAVLAVVLTLSCIPSVGSVEKDELPEYVNTVASHLVRGLFPGLV